MSLDQSIKNVSAPPGPPLTGSDYGGPEVRHTETPDKGADISSARDDHRTTEPNESFRIRCEPRLVIGTLEVDESRGFIVGQRYLDGFEAAVSEFYRDLSADFSDTEYSVVSFDTAWSIARFVGLLPELRPAMGSPNDGSSVALNLCEKTASILECQWPALEIKKALKARGINCTVARYHYFSIEFASVQEERHFFADCKWYEVKLGHIKRNKTKFCLRSPSAAKIAKVEGVSFDQLRRFKAIKHYGVCSFHLGVFYARESAASACVQFEGLVSLIQ
jgi:hypothetical protein